MADPVRVLQQRASAEPGHSRSDRPGQPRPLGVAHQAGRPDPIGRPVRSAGAGVLKQISEAAPEPGLIQARAFLPLPWLLT
jgi:hypothetical protein